MPTGTQDPKSLFPFGTSDLRRPRLSGAMRNYATKPKAQFRPQKIGAIKANKLVSIAALLPKKGYR